MPLSTSIMKSIMKGLATTPSSFSQKESYGASKYACARKLPHCINACGKEEAIGKESCKQKTITRYIEYLCDAFLIDSAVRYDIKGKKYIGTPVKYYFTDIGLRNARLNFRQLEETYTMENIIFNELKIRGFNVDIGVVIVNSSKDGSSVRKQYEIDFVCNKGSKRYYIQSAYAIPDQAKMEQEQRSLMMTGDAFKKIIITKDAPASYYNDSGVLIMSIFDFMLNPDSLEQ